MLPLDQAQYQRLLRLRTGLRRFLRWSAEQAAEAGLTPAQHQLLLAIRGTLIRAGRRSGTSPDTCSSVITAPST